MISFKHNCNILIILMYYIHVFPILAPNHEHVHVVFFWQGSFIKKFQTSILSWRKVLFFNLVKWTYFQLKLWDHHLKMGKPPMHVKNTNLHLKLTHLSRMEFPTVIKWQVHFLYKGCWVVFYICIQISIEHSVSKQWRPWSGVAFCGVCSVCLCPTRILCLYGLIRTVVGLSLVCCRILQ